MTGSVSERDFELLHPLYSDASGMLLLDVKNKKWSKEMLGRNHVYYLPCLMGERAVHNNPAARSASLA